MRDYLNELHESGNERKQDDPVWAARNAMKPKLIKRFYNAVTIGETEEGYQVLLDGRVLKTPGKTAVILPNAALAQAMADEWEAQEERVNPVTMPITRLLNTALDGVVNDPQAVLEDIVKYSASDLLCYRQDYPEGLADLQKQHWDPILDWAEEQLMKSFEVTSGISHVAQPRETIKAFADALKEYNEPFQLTCLHTLCSLTGSALIAFAVAKGFLGAEEAWKAAHIDEDWNSERWGEDEEARKWREERWRSFEAAHRMFTLLTAAT